MHRKSLVIPLLLLASAAAARTAGGDGPTPDTETADTVIVVDKVQVTAIKQGLNLRNQPVTASVIGRTDLERRHVAALKEVSQVVPNFHTPDYGSRMTSSIYIRGLDNLIATARSNKVSVCLGIQDFSQLERDYGEKEAKVIINTVGNIFSGQVVGDTARTLSERFGKIVQMRESHSVSNENITTSTNTQLETLIPASKISNLTQGMFVGAVADNFDEPIPQKIFHAEIVIDNEKVKAETVAYVPIPDISSFIGEDGIDHMEEIVRENYYRVKSEIAEIIDKEIRRIEADPNLVQLLPKKK